MGALQASEFGNMVANGDITLQQALIWHLRSNHYPALPVGFVGFAERAIVECSRGNWDADVPMLKRDARENNWPTPTARHIARETSRAYHVPARVWVEVLHLGAFVTEEREEV